MQSRSRSEVSRRKLWLWSARMQRHIRGTRCRCPSRSACSVFSGLADGSIITRPNWLCFRNWRHLGARIGGFSGISGGPISKRAQSMSGPGWSSVPLPAIPGTPMRRTSASMGFSESGDAAGGAAFLEAWLPDYDRAGQLHCHLSWHLALFELARGNSERARAIYLDSIRPSVAQCAPMLSLANSASFLWRWRLYGITPPLEQEWDEVAAHARRHFPHASLAFADLHAGLAEAATGDGNAAEARIAGLHSLAEEGRLPPGKVAPALCAGTAALARGDDTEAAQVFAAAIADVPRIGGSHAQREVFEDSLIVAYLRCGQPTKAAKLLRARLNRRPSPRDETWLAACSGDRNGP